MNDHLEISKKSQIGGNIEDRRGRTCVPNIVLSLLGTEFVGFICLVVFYDNSSATSNLFYLFCITYLMLWNCYFAWHSLGKENGFELSSFMLMTILVSTEGIYFVVMHSVPSNIQVFAIAYFVLIYLFYLIACYYCYMYFGTMTLNDLDTSREIFALKGLKEYDVFISAVKSNFVVNSLVLFIFIYYSYDVWEEFEVVGISIACSTFVVIIVHICIGIWAVTKEKREFFIGFLAFVPVMLGVILWMVMEICLEVGGSIEGIFLHQVAIFGVLSILGSLVILYLGRRNLKNFGLGRASLIRQTNDDFFKAVFI